MKIISNNKKAQYDYFLSDSLECGMELFGYEVKSILKNGINLKESYVKIVNSEVFLINAHVGIEFRESWRNKPALMNMNEDNIRPRKLLLHKREINKFSKYLKEPGTTLIANKVYIADNGLLKCEISLGKGKKIFDKREVIKKRDLERE